MSKKFSLHHVVLLITVFFLLPAFAVFASVSDSIKIDNVKIAKRAVKSGAPFILRERDTEKGNILVTGEAPSKDKTVDRVEFSIDGGKTWNRAEGGASWRFYFEPSDGEEYALLVHAVTKAGDRSNNFIAIVQYEPNAYWKIFSDIFKDMRDIFMDERYREFIQFFDPDEYPNYATLCENMRNTFELSSNFNIKIQIRDIAVREKMALLRVDWAKTYEDISKDEGFNNIIRFKKKDGVWKIVDIENEAIFVVGTGVFKGNVTDR